MQQDLTTGVSTAEPIAEPRWGLGDVVLGVVLAQVLAVIAFTIASSIAGWKTVDDVPLWGTAVLQIPLWGGWVFAVVVAGRMKGNGVVRDFGFRMKLWDPLIGLAAGIGLQLVVLPLLYIPLLALFDQSSKDLERPAQQLADKAGSSWNWVVLVLIVGIGAPIIEELFYRGLLLRSLTKRRFCPPWVSAVICAAVFAGMHFEALQLPGLFVFGLVASALALRTGRLGPSIWAHIGFNMTTVLVLYLR